MNQAIRKRIADINNGIVPEGYKQTPFGIFPRDWETEKTFDDLFEFNSSLSKSREELGKKGYAYLHYGDMHRNSFNKVSYEQYSVLPKVDIELTKSENYLLQDGDVVFLDASEDLDGTSRCVLVDNPNNNLFFAGLHTIPAREKASNFSKWYKQYITLPDFVRKQFQRLASGFKVYGLNKVTIARIAYAFPQSKDEQSRIAEILMKWDEAIEFQEHYIDLLAKQAEEVLRKLIRYAEGEKKKIKDCVTYHPSTLLIKNLKETENGFPVYGANDIALRIDRYNFDCDAVAIIKYGSGAGRVFYLTGKHSVLGTMAEMRPKTGINIKYIYYTLRGFDFRKYIEISTTPNIYFEDYSETEIIIPSIEKQNSVVKNLKSFEDNILLQKEKLEKLKLQRKAMQQYLLTGIVRVN